MKEEWVYCPVCGSKTRIKIRENTIAKNLPVFCPKCKKTCIANVRVGLDVETISTILD